MLGKIRKQLQLCDLDKEEAAEEEEGCSEIDEAEEAPGHGRISCIPFQKPELPTVPALNKERFAPRVLSGGHTIRGGGGECIPGQNP